MRLMDTDALRTEVAGVTWWHTIDLGNGVVTPGRDETPARLPLLHLPSLAGKSQPMVARDRRSFASCASQISSYSA